MSYRSAFMRHCGQPFRMEIKDGDTTVIVRNELAVSEDLRPLLLAGKITEKEYLEECAKCTGSIVFR